MNLTLFGVALGALVLAIVKVLQGEFGVDDRTAKFVRAGLVGLAYLLVANAEAIQAAWPLFETVVVQVGGLLAAVLGVLGYWPEMQKIYRGARARIFRI